jgi:8-oxo-dGTP diphosphatase
MSTPPPVHYACALPLRGSSVLLGLRSPARRNFPSCWDTIGGHVEAGESPLQALARELAEEIGVTPTTVEPAGRIEAFEPDGETPAVWWLFVVTSWSGGEPLIRNDEHTEIRWFDLAEAENLRPLASDAYRDVFARLRMANGGSFRPGVS